MSESPDDLQRKAKRRERNRLAYEKSKASQDLVLLRLDKGDIDRLDHAGHELGLSRAAFARLYLAPTLGALASRLSEIDKARAISRQSLAQFLSAAINAALEAAPEPGAQSPSPAADEFDALFG